ncbi:hypothetical protein NAPIS_ORF02118 [Vairimorpha apis BRL 01]|uniref:Uncharacterized protein n=1 Tax=Vairimorpha apis BRL 01 TaxID=1037528 RepID=T0MAB7_9MICR|nr:hypothetical protein NAPIS_ORF02118 [Vairimorpha apis BRL 01]
MISTIMFTYLCISNGTTTGESNVKNSLYSLDYNDFLNSDTFNKLLSNNRSELQELLWIKEICGLKSNELKEKLFSLFSNVYDEFFKELENGDKLKIASNFETILIPSFEEYNEVAKINFEHELTFTFKIFNKNKNYVKKEFRKEIFGKKETVYTKLTLEKRNEINILTVKIEDLSIKDKFNNFRKLNNNDLQDSECKNNNNFDKRIKISYSEKLHDILITLQSNIFTILINVKGKNIERYNELHDYFLKKIKINLFENDEEGFEEFRNFFIDSVVIKIEGSLDEKIFNENKNLMLDFLN